MRHYQAEISPIQLSRFAGPALTELLQRLGLLSREGTTLNEKESSDARVNFLDDLSEMFIFQQLEFTQWFIAIIEVSPVLIKFVDARRYFFGENNIGRLNGILLRGLIKLESEQRAKLLKDAADMPDMSLATNTLRDCLSKGGGSSEISRELSLGQQEEAVKYAYLNRIKGPSRDGGHLATSCAEKDYLVLERSRRQRRNTTVLRKNAK